MSKEEIPVCYFCGGNVTEATDAYLVLADQEMPPYKSPTRVRFLKQGGRAERGSFSYPGHGESLVQKGEWNATELAILLSHEDCCPDPLYSYLIELSQILADGVEDWAKHLRETKNWWSLLVFDGLEWAHEIALGLKPKRRRRTSRQSTRSKNPQNQNQKAKSA